MARYDTNWKIGALLLIVLVIFTELPVDGVAGSRDLLTACQHLRRAESRRSRSLGDQGSKTVRVPRCTEAGAFEPVQCSNDINNTECWCVDEYGVEIVGTRRAKEEDVNCSAVGDQCPASSCRMYCPAGFARDARSGCSVCQCRDPCEGITCPGSLSCHPQEVQCSTEPCPPVPTCKKARSLSEMCPVGQPLSIAGTIRPFLCGTDPGKPTCPPLYKCLVQLGNDYGVCCPASLKYEKPGQCPDVEHQEISPAAGLVCGIPCGHDLECPQLQKCCQTSGCGTNCQQPFNVTACHQARMLSELLSVNEREGKGYIPQCDGPGGLFSSKQCSRNGLVCWCVDTKSGHKIKGTMGAATLVDCEGAENLIARSSGRSVDAPQGCDHNICAAVCEYGFKNDHNGCPTCECSEPCEGYRCPMGSHCEVAKDPDCVSGSSLCASEPICKPDLVYSNPCEEGTPLADNVTGEVFFCRMDSINTEDFQTQSFFDTVPEENYGRAMTNFIACPRDYQCTKLHKETNNVCCPQTLQASASKEEIQIDRQQTMCEYLRDFSDRMEGTEEGMVMALPSPRCDKEGMYLPRQCAPKKMKVTLAEQKRLLEERNVRQMKMLLSRPRRSSSIEDVKVVNMDQATESLRALQDLNIRNLVDFLRQKILNPATHPEELYFAEMILNNQDMGLEGRTAKVIDFSQPKSQAVADEKNLFSFEKPKRKPTPPAAENQLVEMEVEECWCVDGFGTEIPRTRGLNTTQEECENLRETLECLDLTCRMGCEYGFILDSDSRCPSCQCRDPCDNIQCPEHQECRTVDVSCDGEYCPPVPACLPRKPGQCPFLVPPGNDDACEYECRSDSHCDGTKRCCSNGCGTQCVEPQLKTACQHLQSIQLHQSIELGIPARQKYIAQCDERNGSWKAVQCGPDGVCWCVDSLGNERSGTRTNNSQPNCDGEPITECPLYKCATNCEHGNLLDSNGCSTCDCRDPCSEISCPNGEKCNLVQVECIDTPCPRMPICVPFMDSVCIEGEPLRQNGQEITCGPQSAGESCPSTHVCQINPLNNKGVCCGKQRDVCFESLEPGCLDTDKDENNSSHVHRWTFNTRLNKCVSIKSTTPCQSKNLFHNENACKAVCPALTQCERLRLKNSLAARRTGGQTLSWFQPRCDPDTGSWSPVQCLGKPVSTETPKGRAFRVDVPSQDDLGIGVCWCADKKGAPLRGSLTRNNEPICNHRQARRRMNDDELQDPVMEELIRQMTILVEDNLVEDEAEITTESLLKHISTTLALNDRILHKSTTSNPRQERLSSTRHLVASSTRCEALKQSAPFPVACDTEGGFAPMQCNGEICWCVDAAGNQLPMSSTFKLGTKQCVYTPIDLVAIELHLNNPEKRMYSNVYEILRDELTQLLGDTPDNLRVHENTDGSIMVKFDLTGIRKIDEAFAIEEMVKQSNLLLVGGELRPDITLSRFLHRNSNLPVPQPASGIPETTFQTIVFIMATASAFLVSVFVIFVMLKRGRSKNKQFHGDKFTMGDKYLDYGSPIFVLAAKEQQDANKFMSK
uniref:Thyroglobulin type i repeat protein n=1 Tax=Lutzomyia longipalpis TaxID=7200 RepID=A0A1B0CNV9_LUTLO